MPSGGNDNSQASQIRVFSFGGGVQSTAALVLSARGVLPYRTFVFANTGDDSENPDTLEYVRNVAMPYAREHGLELIERQHISPDGQKDTLYRAILRRKYSIDIPVSFENAGPGNRKCTLSYKIRVVSKVTKALGATKDNPAIVGVGISLDEFHRMRSGSPVAWEVREYPLIDLRMTRNDCVSVIEREGLPVPPKSSCWFCPMKAQRDWIALHENHPELFERAVRLEEILNERRQKLGKDRVFLSGMRKPLITLIAGPSGNEPEQLMFCDLGSCMT
jgi:3'-phosphoadenosine 5'-phosphosulfate sulfotransferase (PAPS reductase)/FAD synthetase